MLTLLTEQVCTLQDANVALAKRWRAKKSCVQLGGALSIEVSQAILAKKDNRKRPVPVEDKDGSSSKRTTATKRRCGVCGETGYNAQTCLKHVESSSKSESD